MSRLDQNPINYETLYDVLKNYPINNKIWEELHLEIKQKIKSILKEKDKLLIKIKTASGKKIN